MKRLKKLMLVALLPCTLQAMAQHQVEFVIRNSHTKEILPGTSVQLMQSSNGAIADINGIATIQNIAAGKHLFLIRYLGFRETTLSIVVPSSRVEVLLVPEEEELEEVIITTTRSSRNIASIPTRVEFIGAEELEEKITMQPGNIRMVLSESTGIQTQQTSVSSANTTIRIQGLDGRYTQLLKDGFPLYGGFSGGLSIMQIPPLDLQQVDLIKGSASTLYGGGAIAGLINLISKLPKEERELLFFANGTSAKGVDISSYYGEKFKKVGVTVYASRNSAVAYDPADIGFSAIPQYVRYTVNPRVFLYPDEKSTLMIGLNASTEERLGGDVLYIRDEGTEVHSYFEENDTKRYSTQLSYTKKLTNGELNVKNSFNLFGRDIYQRDYAFGGNQLSSFSEINYQQSNEKTEWVFGANAWTDSFKEEKNIFSEQRDFNSTVAGLFVQNVADVASFMSVESGLRIDYANVNANGNSRDDVFVLPRISVLMKLTNALTSRIGGGLGYKTPTLFTEKAEEQVFRNVRPLNLDRIKSERSYGLNGDVNYVFGVGDELTISINQLLFYTRILSPLMYNTQDLASRVYTLENASGHTDAAGSETNLKVSYQHLKLFWGYTYVDAVQHINDRRVAIPLTARHRINSVLMYEVEGKLRLGLEAFYFSPQQLSTGEVTPDYWIFGFSAQKKWQHFSLFANFENFTDTRQTRFGSIYTGSITNPEFKEIYAPLDGFVFNAGLLIML